MRCFFVHGPGGYCFSEDGLNSMGTRAETLKQKGRKMKKLLVLFAVVMFLVTSRMVLFADDASTSAPAAAAPAADSSAAPAAAAPAAAAPAADAKPASQTLTGEVVCLTCYLGHGGSGADHAACGKTCISKGLPVGLKVGDKLYLAIGKRHSTANKMLASYAGKQVTVDGYVSEGNGMSMVEVEKVASAAK